MAELKGAEIFAAGRWNGQTFDEDDLDNIVKSFEALGLSGRIPLKIGHNFEQPLTDGQPALGWVDRIWRDGKKLLANFRDVPRVVYDAIRAGRYKHVSIELLRDVQADTRTVPFVLDAVALLGADVPAVGSLKDLQSLTLSALRGRERLVFSQSFNSEADDMTHALEQENARLRAQLHQQTIDHAIETDVRARLVLPAAREQFRRLFRLDDVSNYQRVSVADWQAFARTQPRPLPSGPASRADDYPGDAAGAPDARLVQLTRQYMQEHGLRHLQEHGRRLDFGRAAAIVAREQAATGLLRAWIDLPGEV